jgi:hypothetical protein
MTKRTQKHTPRTRYQSMKCDLTALQPRVWVQATVRFEMEQISVTKWALKSESCPPRPIWEENGSSRNFGRRWGNLKWVARINGFCFKKEKSSDCKVERLRKKSKVSGDRFLKVDQLVGTKNWSLEMLTLILPPGTALCQKVLGHLVLPFGLTTMLFLI